MNSSSIIRVQGIEKNFSGIRAIAGVDLDIERGSCHALVGENGAGKSTLAKIIAGICRTDAGKMEFDGAPVQFRSPRDALLAGIAMVHQELLFCENLSVAENLCLTDFARGGLFVSKKEMELRAKERISQIGLRVDVSRSLGSLSIAEQQLAQIAFALSQGARLIIFDEPTSSLSQPEAEKLFRIIAQLRTQEVTVVYVSHRLEEVFRLSERVTVLRDGQVVKTLPTGECDEATLVQLMVGRALPASRPERTARQPGKEVLRVQRISSPGKFSPVSFALSQGEILGLAGLIGSGRTQVMEAIFGLDRRVQGEIFIDGKAQRLGSISSAMRCGMGLVPEDRKHHGLVLSMTASDNVTLPILDYLCVFGWLDRQKEQAIIKRPLEKLQTKIPDKSAPALTLSGGNQQKLVFARLLAAKCRILLLDEPTRGVDIASRTEIHEMLKSLQREGAAMLLISSDLSELLSLATRILVFRNGGMAAELKRSEFDQQELLRLMLG